jgi:phage-related protein (TIGR01555 family)
VPNWPWNRPPAAPPTVRAEPVFPAPAKKRRMVSREAVAVSRIKPATANAFQAAEPPPGVVPAGTKIAMDDAYSSPMGWASATLASGAYQDGICFLGYPYLAQIAQRPEYRQVSETIARHMTRNWIKLKSKSGKDDSEKLGQIEDAMKRLGVQQAFCKIAEQDGFFGRGHLYLDFGNSDDRPEMVKPIGDGWDKTSQAKVTTGSLKAVRPVEAVWCFPSRYNSTDPLSPDWYNPASWFVMGKEIHRSRLLTFIGRGVPDLLKPAYSFGGLSLSQMCKPSVDNWLRTRQSVSDIISAFSVFVLLTDVTDSLAAQGDELYSRAEVFNNLRDNSGLLLVDKETEDFKNVSAPLGTLDQLQAQAQEQRASISGIPIVELLGIQPAGLNASSEGEMQTFEGRIHAMQEHLFRAHLRTVLGFVMLSEFGAVDEDIDFDFNPLWTPTEKELREKELAEAQADQIRVDTGIISAQEARGALASDPDSRYAGIDVDDVPIPPGEDMIDAPAPKEPSLEGGE